MVILWWGAGALSHTHQLSLQRGRSLRWATRKVSHPYMMDLSEASGHQGWGGPLVDNAWGVLDTGKATPTQLHAEDKRRSTLVTSLDSVPRTCSLPRWICVSFFCNRMKLWTKQCPASSWDLLENYQNWGWSWRPQTYSWRLRRSGLVGTVAPNTTIS